MNKLIAYIDDKQENLDCMKLILNREFEVDPYLNPLDFLNVLPQSNYSAILLDVHMPVIDGYELYETIIQHDNYNGCPIIFISIDDTHETRVKSLSLGAVDYMDRRMNPEEMLARVHSQIQYYNQNKSILEFDNLKLNLTLLKAFVGSEELRLTFIEFKLLSIALRNYPQLLPKETIVDQVWGKSQVLDATIYTHVSNLNSKLTKWTHEIVSIRSKGLQLAKRISC